MSGQSSIDHVTLEPLVKKLQYRVELSAADRVRLLALPHTIKTVGKDHYVAREGDRPENLCLMLSGFSVRLKTVAGGSRQIIAIQMKGEMVDLQNSLLGVADHSVQMLTSGKIAMIPREEIVRIAFDRPTIGRAMWIDTLVDASMSREWVANVGRRDARTRVAHVLCEFALRLKLAGLGGLTNYELPMTQQQLADTAGVTPVHINRTLKALEADGLIDRPAPRSITIVDWKKLAETGDFQSTYLHLREDELTRP